MGSVLARLPGRRLGRTLALSVAAATLIAADISHAESLSGPAPGATVDELLAIVKGFNPELAAAALESEAALARVVPAGALEDPVVEVRRDQGFRQTMLTVSQNFPLWGKRDIRANIAKANADAAKGRQGDVGRRLDERLKVVFAQYYEVDQAIRVTKEIRILLRTLAATARDRYARGLVIQADAIRAQVEESRLDSQLAALDKDETSAKAQINALIARPANAELSGPNRLRDIPSADSLPLDELITKARNSNPLLAATTAEISAAEGERKLVDKSWYPDVTVTVGGTDMPQESPQVVAGVGFFVPLQWGVRDALAQATGATKSSIQYRLNAELLNIQSELQSSLAVLGQTEFTRDLLKNTLGPESEAAYRSALSSYQLGRGDLTSVLDAVRRVLEIKIERLRIETEAQAAWAAIERLAGGTL